MAVTALPVATTRVPFTATWRRAALVASAGGGTLVAPVRFRHSPLMRAAAALAAELAWEQLSGTLNVEEYLIKILAPAS